MLVERRRQRRFGTLLIPVVLLLLLAGAIVVTSDEVERRLVPPATLEPAAPTAIAVSREERAFYEFVRPRLSEIAAEATALATLGQARSRNLIELQIRSDRVAEVSGEISTYVTNVPVPPRFAAAMAEYDQGVLALRTGMDDARTAFFSFDWEALGPALDLFTVGADRVVQADRMLHDAVGMPIPIASPAS